MNRKQIVMHRSSNMVMGIWSRNVMIKKVYEGSIISRFKYRTFKGRNEMELVGMYQKIK